jgi:hypothetical protein
MKEEPGFIVSKELTCTQLPARLETWAGSGTKHHGMSESWGTDNHEGAVYTPAHPRMLFSVFNADLIAGILGDLKPS